MAGPKQKAAAKKSKAVRSTLRKKATAAATEQPARDVPVGPSAERIERSLDEGTKQTLNFFRATINWS